MKNGADAVYFGTTLFNARMMAKNFTRDEAARAIAYCHERGVLCHVTMNTAVTDRSMSDALRQAEFLYQSGADALIVADLGLAGEIRKNFPDLALHASTQCGGHSLEGARFFKERGFCRMVAARELDRENLSFLCRNAPLEIEVFVHGALCVSQSGQCLFSSFLGGRSGNRGECAQPCRMRYNGRYPLSLKDLCLAGHIEELLSMGAASLKIEGRMKSPAYVGRVTAVYRRLLDEGRNAAPEEMAYLSEIFSRSGFTDGYFTKQTGPAMLGVRRREDIENSRAAARTLPLASHEQRGAKRAEPAGKANGKTDGQSGPASGRRRDAVPPYERSRSLSPSKAPVSGRKERPVDSARFYRPETIPEPKLLQNHGIEIVYLPLDRFDGRKANGVLLPPVVFDSEMPALREKLQKAREEGAVHALVGNAGLIAPAKEAGFCLHGDWRLNICSSYTAALFDGLFDDLLLSPELILPQIRDIRFPKGVVVYGRQPLMTLERPTGTASLTDRTQAVFPLLSEGGREILLNSVPTYMADKKEALAKCGPLARHFLFTLEGKREVESILDAYKKGLPAKKEVRRIRPS